MAAPKGNQFWKLRSKHGRDKLFASPELMLDAAFEYFEWADSTPLKESEAKTVNIGDYQSEIQVIELPRMRAFTMIGLCRYLCCNEAYFKNFKAQLPKDEIDFNAVIAQIEGIVYEQKFTGAAAGMLNANIISRDLGLADKKEVDKKITKLNFKDAQ